MVVFCNLLSLFVLVGPIQLEGTGRRKERKIEGKNSFKFSLTINQSIVHSSIACAINIAWIYPSSVPTRYLPSSLQSLYRARRYIRFVLFASALLYHCSLVHLPYTTIITCLLTAWKLSLFCIHTFLHLSFFSFFSLDTFWVLSSMFWNFLMHTLSTYLAIVSHNLPSLDFLIYISLLLSRS